MSKLTFSHAPMGGGKSLATLVRHRHATTHGLHSVLLVCNPREEGMVTSRVGMEAPAIEITASTDLFALLAHIHAQNPIYHVIADEAHFYTAKQIEELAQVVDVLGVNVEAYGLLSDYRTRLFEASQRLVELAYEIVTLPTRPLCACGRTATLNARLVDGVMVTAGEQIVVGDIKGDKVRYEAVCRQCHIQTKPKIQPTLFSESTPQP